MGTPKALLRSDDGESWLRRSVRGLREAGCRPVCVVLGAAYDDARSLLCGEDVDVVRAEGWEHGMGESLRAGLTHLEQTPAEAAVVTLVDLPDVGAAVHRRVLDAWAALPSARAGLVRATYVGRPGHPVVLGRDHWAPLLEVVRGDAGAQPYLTRPDVRRSVGLVECADLATGRDVDRPDAQRAQRP